MESGQLEQVIESYRTRYTALAERPGIARVLLFRNRGKLAGNSLRHPHAQLIALETSPPEIHAREEGFRTLVREHDGRCPLCQPEMFEPEFEHRLLRRGPHFACWVPWAAEAPCEVWIAPNRHGGDFRQSRDEQEGRELAAMIGWVTRRYRDVAGDPDYNLLLHAAGVDDPAAHDLHWWIRLRPRVGMSAGFELLSGMEINPSSPERDAQLLSG